MLVLNCMDRTNQRMHLQFNELQESVLICVYTPIIVIKVHDEHERVY